MKNTRNTKFKDGQWFLFGGQGGTLYKVMSWNRFTGYYNVKDKSGEWNQIHDMYEDEMIHTSKKKNPEYWL